MTINGDKMTKAELARVVKGTRMSDSEAKEINSRDIKGCGICGISWKNHPYGSGYWCFGLVGNYYCHCECVH